MTRIPRMASSVPLGPYEMELPSAFSCPVFRLRSGHAQFDHPKDEIGGILLPGNTGVQIVGEPDVPGLMATGFGQGVDSDGGDTHVVAITASGNQLAPSAPPGGCSDTSGFTTTSPRTEELRAVAACPMHALPVDAGSVKTDSDGNVTEFESSLVSSVLARMDHGTPATEPGGRGAIYKVELTTVYVFEVESDELSAIDPTPPLDEPLFRDEAQELSVGADFSLRTAEQGDLLLRAFDQDNRVLVSAEPVEVQQGAAVRRLTTPIFSLGDRTERVILRVYLRSSTGVVLAQSQDVVYQVGAELSIDHIEVVQVVQSADNTIPLIANKPTVVRVFTKVAAEASQRNVEVVLTGRRLGSDTPLDIKLGSSHPNPDRREQSHSHDFLLPAAWTTHGSLRLSAEVNPFKRPPERDYTDNVETVTVEFRQTDELRVGFIDICVTDLFSPDVRCPSAYKPDPIAVLRKLYPIENPRIQAVNLPGSSWRWRGPANLVVDPLNSMYLNSKLDEAFWLLVSNSPDGVPPIDRLIAWVPEGRFYLGGRAGSRGAWLTNDSNVGWTQMSVAHELGHTYGLDHPSTPDSDTVYDPFSSWTLPNSTIQEHGFDPVAGQVQVGKPTSDRRVRYDLMTYRFGRRWISDVYYRRLFNLFSSDSRPSGILQGAPQTVGFFSGVVRRDGSGSLDPALIFSTTAAPDVSDASQPACIEFLGDGGVLGLHCFAARMFEIESGLEVEEAPFSTTVVYPDGVTRVRLLYEGVEAAAVDFSANAPVVEITSPIAGDTWDAAVEQTIAWTATDADGDSLVFDVSYSSDGGGSWIPLDLAILSEPSLTFSAALIEGGSNVRFRVRARDGLREAVAEVGPIDIVQRPGVAVDGPIDLGRIAAGLEKVEFVEVRNPGSGPLRVDSIEIDGEGFELLEMDFPLVVPAGGSAGAPVRIAPEEAGALEAQATVHSNAADLAALQFLLRADVTDGQSPILAATPASLDFGPVPLDGAGRYALRLRNDSLVEVTASLAVTGAGFSADVDDIAVQSGEERIVELLFQPQREERAVGELSITTNDSASPVRTVVLAGFGYMIAAPGPQPPMISAGGVVDAAQFQATLSPGGLGSIFGSNLAPSIAGATSTPLPTELAGVSIEVDGVAAPLIFVSPNQINFQMPFEASGSSSVEIRAVRDGVAGAAVQAAVATFAPQVFANPATGEPIVVRQDASLVDAAHPATDGDVLIVYLTGVGGLDNPPATGAATPSSPLASATAETTVTIGGQPAEVFFLGLTPGFVGLVQANIRANIPALPGSALSPEGAAVLTSMPLVVTVDGVSSEPLDLPVDVPGGLPPQIDFLPIGLDFGDVSLGQTGQLELTLFNRGGSDLIIGSVATSGDEFAALAPTGPWLISPGASNRIPVTFMPAEAGTRFGTLTVGSNDPNTPELQVPLVGRGVSETSPGQLSISPATIDFGSIQIGQSAVQDISIGNTGGEAVSLSGLRSSSPAEFSVQLTGAGLPVEIQPGGTYPARIVFQPSTAGERTATLTASSSASGVNATLRGTGVAAPTPTSALVVTRNVLNFGGVSFGRTNELPVVVRNDGDSEETITSVSSSDAQFVLAEPATPIAVAPGAETVLRIHYTPASAGLQQATLTVETPAGPLPTSIAVTGTGQEGPTILFSDSFERPDAGTCAIGQADNALGGSGSHRYSFVAGGVRLTNGLLENAARDFGGVAFSTEQTVCPGTATGIGQEINIRATVRVPSPGGRHTQAGPFFHAPLLTSGARLNGGGQGGHWVQVDSTGIVYAIRLDSGQLVATSPAVAGFDPSQPHVIEVAVRGATAEVAVDGKLRLFDQGAGTGRQSISLVPMGSLNQGAAGVAFSSYEGGASPGGQTMDDVVVTEFESLAGLPVAR